MYLKVKRFLFTTECRRKHILKELDDEEIFKTSDNWNVRIGIIRNVLLISRMIVKD
jgi:hypothetical protein